MHYSQTSVFQKRCKPFTSQIALLQSQHEQLTLTLAELHIKNAGLKKYKQIPTKRIEQKVHSCERSITELHQSIHALTNDITQFSWIELLTMLIELEGHVWNEHELELGKKDREDYEGKFEDSYRYRLGLPLGASLDDTDFPNMSEGKYLSDKETAFRIGKIGKRSYGSLLRVLAREFTENSMSPEQWETMFDGEVSGGKIYHTFPEQIRACIQRQLAPERVLSAYNSFVFLTDVGYFLINRDDYSAAFSLSQITQMSPKYRFKREYIEKRIRALASN